MAGWYVRRGEKVIGPIEVDKLKETVASGKLLPSDQLAKDPAGPWTEAGRTKLFARQQPAPSSEPQATSIVPQGERLPVPPASQPELPKKTALTIRVGQTIGSKVTGGTLATWNAFIRTLSVRAQRKHEIKLARIQANANRPPVSQPRKEPLPGRQQQPTQPISIAPQIVQTTVVKVVNRNGGGCGCSGCGLLVLLVLIALVALAIYNGTEPLAP